MTQISMEAVFFLAAGIVLYTYALYPVLVVLFGIILPRSVLSSDCPLPSVSLIISAFNEEGVIEEKLRNSLELDYPSDLLEIIVASESTDRTHEIVESFSGRGVQLRSFEGRLGKPATLYRVMPSVRGEMVVFSDANAMYRSDAIRMLARGFADPSVGCVVGQMQYTSASGSVGGRGEQAYWWYDRQVRQAANQVAGLVPGINGAIFAIRKALYLPISRERGDDYELCTRVAIHGHAVVLEPDAIAEEEASENASQQYARKVRLVRWNMMSSYLLLKEAVVLGRWLITFQIVSHRLLRYLVPVWLLLAFGSAVWLAGGSFAFRVVVVLQMAFYSCGALGWMADRAGVALPKILLIPSYFLLVNSAALVGIVSGLVRGQQNIWQKVR